MIIANTINDSRKIEMIASIVQCSYHGKLTDAACVMIVDVITETGNTGRCPQVERATFHGTCADFLIRDYANYSEYKIRAEKGDTLLCAFLYRLCQCEDERRKGDGERSRRYASRFFAWTYGQ